MTTVACVGISVHDIFFPLDTLPTGAGKFHATARGESGGGTAANAAVAIAALEGRARLISSLGCDDLGERIVEELNSYGVDTTHVRRIPDVPSPLSAVAVDTHGERLIINSTDPRVFERASPPSAEDLQGVDGVLADLRWVDGSLAALEWARDHNAPAIVDFDLSYADGSSLLDVASHVIFSSGALRRLTGRSDLGEGLIEARERSGAWLAVTNGEQGTTWLADGELVHKPAVDVAAVDTTGAGDVFHGVFALEMARGAEEARAIEAASAAAALSCTRLGGRQGAPTRTELERFLEEER